MHLLVLMLEACSASPITTTTGFTECLRSNQSPTCFCPYELLVLSQTSDLEACALQKCGIAHWSLCYSLGWETTSWSWVLSYIENMNFNLLTKMHISRNWGVEVEVAISCVTWLPSYRIFVFCTLTLLFAAFPIMIFKEECLYRGTYWWLCWIWKLKMPSGLCFDLKKFGSVSLGCMLNSWK